MKDWERVDVVSWIELSHTCTLNYLQHTWSSTTIEPGGQGELRYASYSAKKKEKKRPFVSKLIYNRVFMSVKVWAAEIEKKNGQKW